MNINLLPEDGEAFLLDNIYNQSESHQIFTQLYQEISWLQEFMNLFGRKIPLPRLTAWYGDENASYSYSGILNMPVPWTKQLSDIKELVEFKTGEHFNSALLNLYRNGNDSMGWHSDDEASLGKNPVIASLSFGAERKFQFRHKIKKDLKSEIRLKSGSLLLMKGSTQHYWKHQLPKSQAGILPRINITFRKIYIATSFKND